MRRGTADEGDDAAELCGFLAERSGTLDCAAESADDPGLVGIGWVRPRLTEELQIDAIEHVCGAAAAINCVTCPLEVQSHNRRWLGYGGRDFAADIHDQMAQRQSGRIVGDIERATAGDLARTVRLDRN